jgi:hypothetical protein
MSRKWRLSECVTDACDHLAGGHLAGDCAGARTVCLTGGRVLAAGGDPERTMVERLGVETVGAAAFGNERAITPTFDCSTENT